MCSLKVLFSLLQSDINRSPESILQDVEYGFFKHLCMFPQHDKPFLSLEYLFIYRTFAEFFRGRSDNDSAQVRLYRISTHDLLSGVGLSQKNRPHTLHLVRSEKPLQSSPKTVFQLVIVSVNDCDSDNTHQIFGKIVCDLNKISGPSNVWTLFSPFVPCIERENETVDFMERLPKYPMKS